MLLISKSFDQLMLAESAQRDFGRDFEENYYKIILTHSGGSTTVRSKAQSVEHTYGGLRHIRWSCPTAAIICINFGDVMYV